MAPPLLYVRQLELGPIANFVYLIGDPETRQAMVVDPGWDPDRILRTAAEDGYEITRIMLTHTHPDHIQAVPAMLERTRAKVHVHKKEAGSPGLPKSEVVALSGGDIVKVGNLEVKILHTPGHTPGSQSFLVRDTVVAGDTLFVGSCGRVDLPGSDPEEMWKSLSKLKTLGDDILLYPGHNYGPTPTSRMGDEKKTNPFLVVNSVEQFLSYAG